METINIYLKQSGSVANLDFDFRIYKGSYRNKEIKIYVPMTMITTEEGEGTAVKTAGILTAQNGVRTTTKPYYASAETDPITIHGVQYAVYSMEMPRVYSLYAGEQTIVVNVINVDNTTTPPTALNVVTSQEVKYIVQESEYVEDDEVLVPTDVEAIWAELNNKQDKVDEAINTTGTLANGEHKVVKSINLLNTQVTTNTSDIGSNTTSIGALDLRVQALEASVAGQENPVGKMSVANTLPTDVELNAFVYAEEGRQPELNDVVIVDLQINNVVETYKYLYTTNGWVYYQISEQNPAGNGVFGLVEGTYNIADYSQPINANIVNGQIVNILYMTPNGYASLPVSVNALEESVANIIAGTQMVGYADKANKDGQNNVITDTYARKTDVYTKSESDMKYLPMTYSNIYYYSASGLVEEVPTSPASGVQFSANVPQAGEVQLANCGRVVEGNYHFTKNSTDTSSIWLMTDEDCVLVFRTLTYAVNDNNEYLLSSELSNEIVFTANTPQLVNFPTTYSALGNTSVDIVAGDTFRKEIYVSSADAIATEVDLISSVQYTSTFNLVAQSITFDVNTISGIKAVNILASEWVLDDGEYMVYIPQTRHEQAPTSQYFLALQQQVNGEWQYISFSPIVDTDGNITITNYDAIDCRLLIASATDNETRGIIEITNPSAIPQIDYESTGAIKITQTTEQTDTLTLPNPVDVGKFYAFMVANASSSTEPIVVNGETIAVGKGIQFKWVGNWITGEEPTDTTEVYDSAKSQALSVTLSNIDTSISGLTGDISGLNTRLGTAEGNITSLGTNKQNATDNSLSTTDKTIVGAINELNSGKQAVLSQTQVDAVNSGIDSTKVGQIATNTNNISTNADNITALGGRMTTAEGDIDALELAVKDIAYSAKRSTNYANLTPNNEVAMAFATTIYGNDMFTPSEDATQVQAESVHDYTTKAVIGFGSATADGAGDVIVYIYDGATLLGSKTTHYGNGDALGQIAYAVYTQLSAPNIIVKVSHTFSGNITIDKESGISIQRVDGDKRVSASDNAFDIEFGLRWAKDYANKTITLK